MKKVIFLVILLVAAFVSTSHAWGTLTVFAGEKLTDSKQWKPVNEQFLKGVRLDLGDSTQFANLALDYYISTDEKLAFENDNLTNFVAKTEEIRIGIRSYFGQKIRLFGAGGIANITSSLSKQSARGENICHGSTGYNLFSNGVWIEAGADYAIGNIFIAGLSASYSEGRIKCDGKNHQIGGVNIGAYFGISF